MTSGTADIGGERTGCTNACNGSANPRPPATPGADTGLRTPIRPRRTWRYQDKRRFAALGVTTIALLASALALTAVPALAADAPGATTGDASGLTDTQATLAGTVNPQGLLTSYAFQYGTTTAYGQQTGLSSAGSGTADVPVREDLAGLTAGTTYHYRLIATNASGTTVGADR